MRRREKRLRRLGLLPRTTQIIFGERQSLANAFRLVQSCRMDPKRRRLEESLLRQQIRLRTIELNSIHPDWDRRVALATRRRTPASDLRRLARALPPADYYLARLLSDHPNTPPDVLARLARHPYRAARENVARHPRTPLATLRALCRDRREPLWYLVAFNPSIPPKLREQLRARLKRRGERR
jgi:hypothetical protein